MKSESKRLSEVLEIRNGYAFDSDLFDSNEGKPLIRIRDLKGGKRTVARFRGDYDPKYLVTAGDVLIGMDGEFRCYKWKGEEALLNQRVCKLHSFSEDIEPDFVFFALNERLREIEDATPYSTVKHLSSKKVSNIEISFPPISEQRRIVVRIQECLSRVEELELLIDAQADSFVHLKRSLVFGEPGESSLWEVVKHSTKWIQETEKVQPGERYQFAGVKSFGRGVFSSAQKTSDDFEYGQLRRLKTNDFIYPKLMAWEGAFGMVSEALSGMVVSPEFVVFRTDESRLLPEVLDTYFRSPACLPEVNSASTGSNRRRRRLNPKAFLELRVPVPPMDRQKKLREVYRLESEMLGDVETTKSELKGLRNAILRQAFAGEL